MPDPKDLQQEADQLDARAEELKDAAHHKRRRSTQVKAAEIITTANIPTDLPVDWGNLEGEADDLERDASRLEDEAADKRRDADRLSAELRAEAADKRREAYNPNFENTDEADHLNTEADELDRRAAGL
jgi:hypothetical protein